MASARTYNGLGGRSDASQGAFPSKAHGHPGERNLSWLPQYHDMGLIAFLLSVYVGTGYYMSPLTFLQNPLIWPKVCEGMCGK